jgi:hypothetical protein
VTKKLNFISNKNSISIFIVLVLIKQIIEICVKEIENIDLILYNKITCLYSISLFFLLFFLRYNLKLLFTVFLVFYSDFFIDLKYIIQPYTFSLFTNLLNKQAFTFVCLLIFGILIYLLIKKYFKYIIVLFIIKYTVAIVFLLFLKNEKYQLIKSKDNYKAEKNCYILLFDEYPSQFVINKFLGNEGLFIKHLVANHKFNQLKKVRSNYINTEMSIPSILYGNKSSHFRVRDAINSLSRNRFTKNNKFVGYSFFDSVNSKDAINNSNFIHSINCLATRYFFPLLIRLLDSKGHGVFFNVDQYHNRAIDLLKNLSNYRGQKKQVVFIHYYTPHEQVFSKRKNILDRIKEANGLMLNSINIIDKNDPKASVIIMSDHGYRGNNVPEYYRYNGLLLYKNIDLDTISINKNGIVSLFDK